MKRSFTKLISGLLRLIGPFIFVIFLAVVNGVVGFVLSMNITIFAAIAILKYFGIAINMSYTLIFTIIVVSGFLRGIVRYFEQYSNHYMAFKLLAVLRDKIFTVLRRLGGAKLDDKNKGEIISLLQSDIETLEVFYAHTITPTLIAIIVSTIVTVFLGIFASWYFALIALISYVIIGFIIPVIFYKHNNKFGKNYRQELGLFEEFYLDSIYGSYEIVSQNRGEKRKESVSLYSKSLLKLNDELEKRNVFFKNVTSTIIILCNIAIIFVGLLLYKKEIIASPYIILAYVTLTSSFGSVVALANLPNNLAMTFASGNRVLDLLEEMPNVVEGKNDILDFEEVKLANIAFKYNDELILNNVNLEIKKGEIVGILGPSGSGKSTILKLLMHFYNPTNGKILYNAKDINDYSFKALYNNVNLFSQTTYLFSDTILNNILIAKPDAKMEEVKLACKNASILEFIESLPNGFETRITDLKDNISTGEKQRLGLARVFLRKPKLLLLDEATSNIDAINEGVILKAIKEYQEDMAIVIISHRKSTLGICEKIYELKDGTLCFKSDM